MNAAPRLVAVHQPNFLPRLSTLAKLAAADVWIVLDNVQFAQRDYQQRCRLGKLGDPTTQQWLTLPVHRPHGRDTLIHDVQVVDAERCRRRVQGLLWQYYGRSPHWRYFREPLKDLLRLFAKTDHLADVTELSTALLLRLVGWQGKIVHSKALATRTGRSERLADLTVATGGTNYLCGAGGSRYLDTKPFHELGVSVTQFRLPEPPREQIMFWAEARRVTALWAVMTFGVDFTTLELASLHPDRRSVGDGGVA